ncbi:MAG TPA: glycoside hydrolase family 43 protein [Ktedonobacteraceae bacterium]|nr:glycoside hydrolase family 43 protein [Ktedonobacteraceae bacterium]
MMFHSRDIARPPFRQQQLQAEGVLFHKKRSTILYLSILSSLLLSVCFFAFSPQAYAARPPAHARHHARAPFTNPILPVPDPFVTRYNGTYYVLGTTGNNVTIWSSPYLESVSQKPTVVWTPQTGQPAYQIWSPSLFLLNYHGAPHWFVYYTAASTNDNANHRIYVLMSNGRDPLGPYTFQGQLAGSDNTTTIDPSIILIHSQLYILDVEEPGVQHVGEPGANVTYIAPLSDPLTQSGPSQSLIYPDQSWERGGGSGQSTYPVSEGPEALYHNGKTFIVYSGSDTGDYTYCLGLLTYNGGDPLDFHSWSKSGPVFQYSAANGVYGPGRASFTTSPDGTQSWMVYHAKTSSAYIYSGRTTRAQQFSWNQDGTPNFGVPVSTSTPITPPSGE